MPTARSKADYYSTVPSYLGPSASPSFWLIIVGLFVAVIVTGGAALAISQSYQASIFRTESNLRNLSLVLSEQTDGAIHSLEVVQADITGRLLLDGVRTVEDLRRIGSQQATHRLLADRADALPQADGIAIIDAIGQAVATSKQWPLIGEQDLSFRTYVRKLQANPELMTFISEPIVSLDFGERSVALARKILSEDGTLIGFVVVAIKLRYFEDLYRSLHTTDTGTFTLFRQDGILLIRNPPSDENVHERESAFAQSIAAGQQSINRGRSSFDGHERIAAGRSLTRFPVAVVATDTVASAISQWKKETAVVGTVALLMNLALGTALFLGHRVAKVSLDRVRRESHLARHDFMTELPNRLLFNEEISRAMTAVSEGGAFALLLLDLDRFKEVNDRFGHPLGDQLLMAVTQRIRSAVPSTDMVARIGGDEFAVIVSGISSGSDPLAMATDLIEIISETYRVEGYEISIAASIGIAIAPEHGETADDLLKAADLALYNAKRETSPTFRVFDAEMNQTHVARLALEDDLRQSVRRNEFELHYQPVLDLKTNTISGFEALARWQHPIRGSVPPSTFIPIAEAIGMIGILGDWVLETACSEAATWPSDIRVAVNLSPLQFKSSDILSGIRQALGSSGLSPHRLDVEITETVLLDAEAQAILPLIKSLGVSISLDDFGTGYASLSYLCRLPFDKLKIDQSFVREMATSGSSRAVVHATLYLARELGITTTAEGVETEEQLNALREAGATEVQGYLISRPVPASLIPSLLQSGDLTGAEGLWGGGTMGRRDYGEEGFRRDDCPGRLQM